jgi:hypothetical protein
MKIVGCDLHTRYQAGWPSPPCETLEGAPSKLCLGRPFDPPQIIQRANRRRRILYRPPIFHHIHP